MSTLAPSPELLIRVARCIPGLSTYAARPRMLTNRGCTGLQRTPPRPSWRHDEILASRQPYDYQGSTEKCAMTVPNWVQPAGCRRFWLWITVLASTYCTVPWGAGSAVNRHTQLKTFFSGLMARPCGRVRRWASGREKKRYRTRRTSASCELGGPFFFIQEVPRRLICVSYWCSRQENTAENPFLALSANQKAVSWSRRPWRGVAVSGQQGGWPPPRRGPLAGGSVCAAGPTAVSATGCAEAPWCGGARGTRRHAAPPRLAVCATGLAVRHPQPPAAAIRGRPPPPPGAPWRLPPPAAA